MRPRTLIRKIHRWVGLILGIQILLWFFSGFLMSWMPIDEIRGDHLLKPHSHKPIDLNGVDLGFITKHISEPIESTQVRNWLGQTVVEVTTSEGIHMFNTSSQQPLSPIKKEQVLAVLDVRLIKPYEVIDVAFLTEVPAEARGRQAPLWQVQLAGTEQARIYVDANTGKIVAKRTDRWRLFDFLGMLHIMDYDEREDFNHPLLYLTAFSALLFTLSGFVLLYFSFKKPKNQRVQ